MIKEWYVVSVFNIQYLIFSVQCSVFSVQYSVLSIPDQYIRNKGKEEDENNNNNMMKMRVIKTKNDVMNPELPDFTLQFSFP